MKWIALLALCAAGCGGEAAVPVAAVAAIDAGRVAAPPSLDGERRAAAESALQLDCAICHSIDLVQSQRLNRAQWEKEVKKMAGWGAPVDGEEAPLLVELLAADFPPDGGAASPAPITVAAAQAAVTPDAIPAPGDLARGEATYRAACQSCHGPAGEGTRGPSLAGKPVVHRARDFAAVVAEGRGRMPAFAAALSPEAIGDLRRFLAHLPP